MPLNAFVGTHSGLRPLYMALCMNMHIRLWTTSSLSFSGTKLLWRSAISIAVVAAFIVVIFVVAGVAGVSAFGNAALHSLIFNNCLVFANVQQERNEIESVGCCKLLKLLCLKLLNVITATIAVCWFCSGVSFNVPSHTQLTHRYLRTCVDIYVWGNYTSVISHCDNN